MQKRLDAVTIAWLITAVYCFFQYSLRSAPSVMIPELGTALGLNAMGAAGIALTTFPPSRAATLIGATQLFGMAGGAAGPSCRRSSSRCY